jgi:choline dehydrogenase-like flavoprotein
MRTRVLIVGGGPVGLTLAMDLAWRGIDVLVAERRPPNDPPNVKCGQIGARSMEIFRRLGLADKLRGIGLPADYPNDIVSATSVTGIELSRVLIPARGARGTPAHRGQPGPRHKILVAGLAPAPSAMEAGLTAFTSTNLSRASITFSCRSVSRRSRS